MSRVATSYPSCGNEVPRGLRFLALAAVLLVATLSASCDFGGDEPKKAWTPEEIAEANNYWEIHVQDLMQAGMIARHEVEGDTQVVYVDRTFWKRMGREEKESLLRDLSRNNEVLGRTTYVEIRDRISERVFAEGDAASFGIHR